MFLWDNGVLAFDSYFNCVSEHSLMNILFMINVPCSYSSLAATFLRGTFPQLFQACSKVSSSKVSSRHFSREIQSSFYLLFSVWWWSLFADCFFSNMFQSSFYLLFSVWWWSLFADCFFSNMFLFLGRETRMPPELRHQFVNVCEIDMDWLTFGSIIDCFNNLTALASIITPALTAFHGLCLGGGSSRG